MSLIDSIKKHEGFSSVVYKCTAGYDTIGYGKRIKYLKVTEEQSLESTHILSISDPNLALIFCVAITLPFDFDILLPFASTVNP